MRRFKFRLESVLDQRKRIETQAKSNFAEAALALNRATQLLQELEDVRAAIIDELSQIRLSGDFNPDESRIYQDYLTTINQCIRDQKVYLSDVKTTYEAFRLNLVGASRSRQVVDKLKERDQAAHIAEGNKVEQAATDEMAATRHQYLRPSTRAA